MRSSLSMGTMMLLHVYLYAPSIAAQSPPSAQQHFRQFGISPLASPVPVSEFTLPDLDGNKHSLKDYRGQWVLLNLWATWCDACAAQIDALRALEQSQSNQGLKILAVAVDGTPDALRKYQQRKKMNFTILHDSVGTIAATYKANSIPLNYIIDPQGQIVALVRGAFQWQKTIPLFAQLNGQPYDPKNIPTNPTPKIELDPDLEPPELKLQGPTTTIQEGRTFEVNILVTWSGQLKDYILEPPKLNLPDQIEHMGMQALASGQQGRQALTYKVSLKANQPGEYLLGPVDLQYRPRIEQNPLSTRHQGLEINVQPLTHMGSKAQYALLIAGLLMTLGLLGAYRRRKNQTRSPNTPEPNQARQIGQLVEDAQRAKMNGDTVRFLEASVRFIEICDNSEILGHNKSEIQHFLEKARFANQPPQPEVIASIERHMQRHFKEIDTKATD